ncbi:hypothetical protein SEA_DAUBENSKI_259 [Streptomyces phage Daubenski]|uniref:Uncharacterized protein n=1 Tax=Streptomyces phage Daubenski TaxID=2653725 RepID=A0A5Q2WD14_9CAUD|nr:hypothetical protein KNU80_gp015 [Streptomyces phage Daubenski]YP_010104983.1 hypothetical protein KNU80_gp046 [Streptomyces phage Daubenski]QGH76326.1 hypothetical protein SEA_DAUBENSKI_15 [Streptomyces phage Daubenski]QGH76524.1 hypothetical protein SEA_DAUBENSKI_259 [Streptomyces phage Daubenski]
MAVSLAKVTDAAHKVVSSVTLTEGFKVKGSKSTFSIRLETWQVPGAALGNTEVRVVVRDQDGKFHGATNFRQNIVLDFTNLMNGNHSNKRAGKK